MDAVTATAYNADVFPFCFCFFGNTVIISKYPHNRCMMADMANER